MHLRVPENAPAGPQKPLRVPSAERDGTARPPLSIAGVVLTPPHPCWSAASLDPPWTLPGPSMKKKFCQFEKSVYLCTKFNPKIIKV